LYFLLFFLLIILQPDKSTGTIKEQLAALTPTLEHLRKQKQERVKEFMQVQLQIQNIQGEIIGGRATGLPQVDEQDLSLDKLDEYQSQLKELQKEKVQKINAFHRNAASTFFSGGSLSHFFCRVSDCVKFMI
jgi:Microtubule associated protein (MAP65/ASE1 family)